MSPFTGLIFDFTGFYVFLILSDIVGIIFIVLIFIPNYYSQLLGIIFSNIWLSTLFNVVGKWCLKYAPPDLLGVSVSIYFGIAGLVQFGVNYTLTYVMYKYSSGVTMFIIPLIITSALWLITSLMLTVRVKINPPPETPPERS